MLRRYLDNRSLWGDEAGLAASFLQRDLVGLLEPLEFGQASSPGFLGLTRLAVILFGTGEMALRLVPLLTGLLSVLLFLLIARRLLDRAEAAAALLLYALSDYLVYYASEFKQYCLDISLSLLLTWVALRYLERPGRGRLAVVALVGALGTWFGQSLIFTCAAAGIVLAGRAITRRRPGELFALLGMALLWVGSVALQYRLFIRRFYTDRVYQDWWRGFLVPFPPTSARDLDWYWNAALGFFTDPVGLRGAGLAGLVATLGVAVLRRRSRTGFLLLVLPFLAVAAASAAGFYPFATRNVATPTLRVYPALGRLILFLVPPVLMAMAAGLVFLLRLPGGRRGGVGLLASLWLLALPGYLALVSLVDPPRFQEMRPLVERMTADAAPGDVVLVHEFSQACFDYYHTRQPTFGTVIPFQIPSEKERRQLDGLLSAMPPGSRVWLVTLHHPSWDSGGVLRTAQEILERWADRRLHLAEPGATGLLYVRR
jgi:hypothetical protein